MGARSYFDRRLKALDTEWSSFEGQMREISDWLDPRGGRFTPSDVNKGDKKHFRIINNKAAVAKRVATSGFFAGTMSPSRPWFKLETIDKDLMASTAVQQWLFETEEIIRGILTVSNFYSMAPTMLGQLLMYGTCAMSHVDNFNKVAKFFTHAIGSYRIAVGADGEVDTFVLRKRMTARQLVEEFGIDNVSEAAKRAYELEKRKDDWFDVVQFIEPNPKENDKALDSKFKKFRSVWYQPDNTNPDQFLREKGFAEFPVYVIRFAITGEDIYGTECPGMVALGDVRALQEEERQKALGTAKQMAPVLKGPGALRDAKINNMANSLVIYDNDGDDEGLTPVYEVAVPYNEMRIDIQAVEKRIDEAFFVDLFKAISSMQGVQPRNQLELSQRNGEALLQLGPALGRVQREFLNKVLERTFNQAAAGDLLPEAPEELVDAELDTRFISSIAQAQKSEDVTNLENYLLFAEKLAAIKPSAIDKINEDGALDGYAQMTGVIPGINKDADTVAAEREARANAEAQAGHLENEQKRASANVQDASADKMRSEIE